MESLHDRVHGRVPSLDGLRAVSIALVLLNHATGSRHFLTTATMTPLGDLGNLGVRVFFVISGYLITHLLLLEQAKTGAISLSAFYMRRLLRIFPAFFAFVTVLCALAAVGFVQVDRGDLLHAVTYTMNYHLTDHFSVEHLWSLSVEEQFYLLWPGVLVLLGLRRSVFGLGAVVATAPLVRIALYRAIPGHEELIRMSFETTCDALATGCLLAIGGRALFRAAPVRTFLRHPFLALLPAAILVANRQQTHPNLFYFACIPFMNVSIAVLIARYIENPELPAARLLNSAPFVAVGVASYSLYLWQQVFLIQFRSPQTFLQTFPFSVLMAAMAATGSYFLIEQPFLGLKRRFEPRKAKASVDVGEGHLSLTRP